MSDIRWDLKVARLSAQMSGFAESRGWEFELLGEDTQKAREAKKIQHRQEQQGDNRKHLDGLYSSTTHSQTPIFCIVSRVDKRYNTPNTGCLECYRPHASVNTTTPKIDRKHIYSRNMLEIRTRYQLENSK